MMKIKFPCMECGHKDICIHVLDMKKIDEQLKNIDVEQPFVTLNVDCSKFLVQKCPSYR